MIIKINNYYKWYKVYVLGLPSTIEWDIVYAVKK